MAPYTVAIRCIGGCDIEGYQPGGIGGMQVGVYVFRRCGDVGA